MAFADPLDDGRAAWRRGDYEQALTLLRPLADAGDSAAQATLALMYEFGQGVQRSPATAAQFYEAAAPAMDLEFRHNLGMKYYTGDGLTRDLTRAAHWWREAAERGLAESQYDLGLLYFQGKGVEQDFTQAFRWYEAAAVQGFARAQHGLGVLYATGRGVGVDYTKAAQWFERGADRDFPKSQYNLALLLLAGRGVEVDVPRAEELLRSASAAGEQGATLKLAELERERSAAPPARATPAREPEVRVARPASEVAPPVASRDDEIPEVSRVPAPVSRTSTVARAPTTPAPTPRASTPTPRATSPGTSAVRSPERFSQAPSSAWTLQLASMSTQTSAQEMVERLRAKVDGELYVFAYRVGDGVRHAVLLGIYDDRASANSAAGRAAAAAGSDPWVRRVGAVRDLAP
ncbi:MAG: SPOR domain-containing protein [Pseudomonadota bacterium]